MWGSPIPLSLYWKGKPFLEELPQASLGFYQSTWADLAAEVQGNVTVRHLSDQVMGDRLMQQEKKGGTAQ